MTYKPLRQLLQLKNIFNMLEKFSKIVKNGKMPFMHCFHWNRPYDPRVGCKSRRVGRKSAGKWWVGYEIPNRTVKLQTGRNGHPDKP